ncbi:MAG: hypothetical protein ACK6BU_00330 [Cyanobacteriota bacterium]|jgi:hypothetical protein
MTGSQVKPSTAASTAASRPAPLANGPWGSLKQLLDRLLVVNVFLVIGAALWFGLAVVLQSQGRGGPLRAFQSLWEPLIMPSVGLLMAAALLSGILGWWQRRGQP